MKSTNTDVEGFLANLDDAAPGWDRARDAVVLGAGGAARAVVFGLIERGFKRIHVVNRTPERAQALRATVRRDRVARQTRGELAGRCSRTPACW